jgi:IS5 family transposase
MRQTTFATMGFDRYAKTTRTTAFFGQRFWAAFLAEMDKIVPWKRLRGVIEPFYPLGPDGL